MSSRWETAESEPLTQKGRDPPPLPPTGLLCYGGDVSPDKKLRPREITRLSDRATPLSADMRTQLGCCTPNRVLISTLRRKETPDKILKEPGPFITICPLGEDVKFSNRLPS